MSKLLTAIVVAAIGIGLNPAIAANDSDSAKATNWSQFQSMVKKCDALAGAEKKQCMTDARNTYRSSNFKCDTMSGTNKSQCLKYAEEWKSANVNQPNAAVTHTEDPTMDSPAGDPSASERNRDSTKQQEDATRSMPESKGQKN